jgi:hypothetical protein
MTPIPGNTFKRGLWLIDGVEKVKIFFEKNYRFLTFIHCFFSVKNHFFKGGLFYETTFFTQKTVKQSLKRLKKLRHSEKKYTFFHFFYLFASFFRGIRRQN